MRRVPYFATAPVVRVTAVVLAFLFGFAPRYAAQERAGAIHVGPNVRVGSEIDRPLTEPHVASHPDDPNHLLGAAIVADIENLRSSGCSTFLSRDGGRTWQEGHTFDVAFCFDPWVVVSPAGDAVFVAMGEHASITDRGVLAFHSPDGGRTWSVAPSDLGWPHDHPMIAIDTGEGERRGWIYVVTNGGRRPREPGKQRWNVYAYRSTDGGRSFTNVLTRTTGNLVNITDGVAVLHDGALVVPFVELVRYVSDERGSVGLKRLQGKMLRSDDGGTTFTPPLFVTERCWSRRRFATDLSSGPYGGRLYVACLAPGRRILLLHSDDRGETWSDGVEAHATADAAFPLDNPILAVNDRGVVGLAWVDEREDIGGGCYRVYFTASLDGGRTFLPEEPVSSARSCPDSTVNGAAFERWPMGGDYFGMTAAADGRFHLLWADARTGKYQLWTAPITVATKVE